MPMSWIPAALAATLLFGAMAPLSVAATPTPATQAAAAPAASTTAPTHQQIYDSAQAAFDKGDWGAAITGWSSIVLPEKDGNLSRSQGAIHARLARA